MSYPFPVGFRSRHDQPGKLALIRSWIITRGLDDLLREMLATFLAMLLLVAVLAAAYLLFDDHLIELFAKIGAFVKALVSHASAPPG